MDVYAIGHTLSIWLLPILVAVTLHEAAHGWAADRLGDDTARRLGRVSLNPIRHIDPIGTLLLPGLLLLFAPFVFGWAKPVPVSIRRLKRPKRDMALVAAAGPACNFLIAILCAWLLLPVMLLEGDVEIWLIQNLANAILINLLLGVFNLFPLPPLDGGRIAVGLLPRPLAIPYARLEPFGLPILLALIIVVPYLSREFGGASNPLASFIMGVLQPALGAVAALSPWTTQQLLEVML